MPPWLSHISSAQKNDKYINSSRWVQLATVGLDNTPRVRTVVFRGWSDSYEMKILTDKRSQKYHELERNSNVEICWLFPKSKCQFRLSGTSRIDLGKDNLRHWEKLDNKEKAMWSWPDPGILYNYRQKVDLDATNNLEKSVNFLLLKIEISCVEQLILRKPIHLRRRWLRKNNWFEEWINP